MAGLLTLLIVHIVLNVKHWIGGIRRNVALDRLWVETANQILDIEKEPEKYNNIPLGHKIGSNK